MSDTKIIEMFPFVKQYHVSYVECDKCYTSTDSERDPETASIIFYNLGWRIFGDELFCPKCSKNKK